MPNGLGTTASVPPHKVERDAFAGGHTGAFSSALRRLGLWGAGTALVCLLVATPLLAVVFLSFGDNQDIWSHLAATVLPDYIVTTGLLMLGARRRR